MKKLDIIYEDKNILVVNKPANLLTIATEKEKYNTLYHEVYEYIHKKNKHNRIFIVHRLDYETSGLVLFAKSEQLKKYFQDNWNNIAVVREYISVVEGNMEKDNYHVEQNLIEDNFKYTKVSNFGKKAITDIEVLKRCKKYSIVKVNIKTGRKNQIRVALSSLNHPIIGDKKYGNKKNNERHMFLHHHHLSIIMPDKTVLDFTSKLPNYYQMFK